MFQVSTAHLLTPYTAVMIASLERRIEEGEIVHFSTLVKINREGGNMFDQGARYDSKGN